MLRIAQGTGASSSEAATSRGTLPFRGTRRSPRKAILRITAKCAHSSKPSHNGSAAE